MKKLKLLGIVLSLVTTTAMAQSAGQPATGAPISGEKKGWPSADRYKFITDCMGTAQPQLEEGAARYYCYCMQDRLEQLFPDIDKANQLTEADLAKPNIQKAAEDCKPGGWPEQDRRDFIQECSTAAGEGMTKEKAKLYCECMVYKVEKAFPDPKDVANLTEDALSTPEWEKKILACLEF